MPDPSAGPCPPARVHHPGSVLRVPAGPVDLRALPTGATPGFTGDKAAGRAALAELGAELADLQERLFAEGRAGEPAPRRSILLVLQGMDTSGKGGTLRGAIGLLDPQGVRITSFGAPTAEESGEDFLCRIRRALPAPGYVGAFDRSHYEDVLVHRVRGYSPPEEIERRYGAINDFERELADSGTVIVKCLLHISPEEQKRRLLARLANPAKHWKLDPRDFEDRARWAEYREAYEIALERTSTDHAPWYVVPADRKWYRDLAVARLLRDVLRALDPQWPAAAIDPAAGTARLLAEDPLS